MDAEIGQKTIGSLQARNRSLTIIIFTLLLLCFALVIVLMVALMSQKTIIQPSEKGQPSYIIGDSTANKDYLIKMSDFIINKMYNVTPTNAVRNFEDVLYLTDERTYPKMKAFLTDSATRITREGITSVWSTGGDFKVDEAKKEVTISGIKKTYLADKLVAEQNQQIKLMYTMKNGKIALYSASEVKENEIQQPTQ